MLYGAGKNLNLKDKQKPKKYYDITEEGIIALDKMIKTWSVLSQEMDNIIGEAKK